MSSSTGFSQRLREYILKKHGSINSFCKAVGIKYPAQMTPYLQGKCRPGKKLLERLKKDGADIELLLNGYIADAPLASLSEALAFSCSRMDIDNLFRQVHLNVGSGIERFKPVIDAYAIIDYSKRLVDMTGSIENFLGYELNALSDVGLDSLIHPEDYVLVKRRLERQQQDNDIVNFHSRFKTGKGTYMFVEWCLYIKCKPMSDLREYTMILRRSGN
ncbi:MAG: PAS domain S-box protein [Chlorobiaceae bacterium]|jgi:PAS domain S-box-containing protein|nr:PAS domain S-box protein [Chlorobiaceae bacterium]NTV17110.1 PAS domain S-box protein [Chlorobiaceae bacterium]